MKKMVHNYSEELCTLMDNGGNIEEISRTCKDKAIIIGSWLYRKDIPFRFVACSYKPEDEIHHVIVQTQNPKMFIDATYPEEDSFPSKRTYYNILPLTGWIIIPLHKPYWFSTSPSPNIPSPLQTQDFLQTLPNLSPL